MDKREIKKMQEELQSLPTGGITYKRINGKEYAYYQWREDGKQRARRAKDDELEVLTIQIERRRELQDMLRGLGGGLGVDQTVFLEHPFNSRVFVGDELENFVNEVRLWEKRDCFERLHDYVYGERVDKVYVLYGLRRTGKTTLMRQVIADMDESMKAKTAYMQVLEGNTLREIDADLRYLERKGYTYIFIDEVTLLEDFIQGAALFSDIYASCGIKVVLSGTDSLSFLLAKSNQLFDRCFTNHTTFISYREFERVLGVKGIDNYIRYGGTMSLSGEHYNFISNVFSSEKSIDEYVDSAIAHNIQHSLRYYNYERHFRSLWDLYEADELTSAINRIVENINHRFTVNVLTKDFRSSDISISSNNLREDKKRRNIILDTIDRDKVTEKLRHLLEIKNKPEQTVEIDIDHCDQIKEYLDLLDLTVEIRHIWMQSLNRKDSRTVFTQPGLRYAQAEFLIKSLMEDEIFADLSLDDQEYVSERIMSEIKGRMMEDIVLLETKMARRDCEVFCLKFAVGEFDMVVFDRANRCCEIFEIKHSAEIAPEQRIHLLDEEKCERTAFRYGRIKGKYVIYRGEAAEVDGVKYLNVEEYLKF